MVRILELARSTYFPAFERLSQEVAKEQEEATEIVRYLKPLKPYFEKLSMMDDFVALADVFVPILHILLLVWKMCK